MATYNPYISGSTDWLTAYALFVNAALNAVNQPESGPEQVELGIQLHMDASETITDFVIQLPFDLPGNTLTVNLQTPFDANLTLSDFAFDSIGSVRISAENTSASPLLVPISVTWAVYPVVP